MSQVIYGPESTTGTSTHTYKEWTATNCTETGTLSQTVSANVSSFDYRRAVGFRTPGWRKIRNSGAILPMTPWVQTETHALNNIGTRGWCTLGNRKGVYVNYRHGWAHIDQRINSWTGDWLMSLVSPPDLQYYVQKAAAGIYTSGWDAATFLAEIGQLRRMLTGVGKKLDDLSRGRSPGELYNLWLEGRYGWRTLRYDIQDLLEVLSRANERRTRYRETKGFTDSGLWTKVADLGTNPTVTDSTSISWTINMRGTVVADIDVPDFRFNPVTTAWEVTKLSFVVDWLLNVGQALEAASFLLAVKSYKACGGYRVDFNMSGDSVLKTKGNNQSAFHTGSCEGTAYYLERVPMSVSASPHMKLRLDGYKVIDLLSLVMQRLR